jgi:hypothetical protein
MSVVLSSPAYSYIQIQEPELPTDCVKEIGLCLPIYLPSDLSFQLIAKVSGADKDWFEIQFETGDPVTTHKETVWARVCVDCANIEEPYVDLPHSMTWTGRWRKIEEGSTDTWVGNFTTNGNDAPFLDLPIGTCFNLCFHKVQINIDDETETEGLSTVPIACTDTCFQRIDDDCFTSWFTYQSNEDSMGFIYTSASKVVNFANQVRLPCYLRDIQFPIEEMSYEKSNGDEIKLYARIHEDYELVVDWIPKAWHKRLVILLHHDIVKIDNPNDGFAKQMFIVCKEKYQIDWPKHPWQHAPAITRVKRAKSINLVNSNCQ